MEVLVPDQENKNLIVKEIVHWIEIFDSFINYDYFNNSILILGVDQFKNLRIKVRVSGGGAVAQLYAARMAIAKGIVAWNQKYVDEEEKDKVRKDFMNYDKTLLVADNRRIEPKKYGGPGARARYQKSYR